MFVLGTSFKEDFSLFLKNNAFFICLGIVVIILVTVLAILLANKKSDKKTATKDSDFDKWITALGDKENIIAISSNGSRLSVELKDVNKVDKDSLKNYGVSSLLTMSNKVILVISNGTKDIEEHLNHLISNNE